MDVRSCYVMRQNAECLGWFRILFVFLCWSSITALAQPPEVSSVQTRFRWRLDDGGEAAATWMTDLNMPVTLDSRRVIRLRINVDGVYSGPPLPPPIPTGGTMKLQYSRDGAGWVDVLQSAGGDFQLVLSSHFADGDPTTEQISNKVGFTFGGGRMTESAESFFLSIGEDIAYEHEWCIGMTQSATNATYRFRMDNIDLWSRYPNLTLAMPELSFTDGSGFVPAIVPGTSDQVLGHFELVADKAGASLAGVDILLTGTRTGLSNLRLWFSLDDSFSPAVDVQLGIGVAVDPGSLPLTFSGFSQAIPITQVHFFLTADVAAGATGNVQPLIESEASITINDGQLLGPVMMAPLSSGGPVPVVLEAYGVH